MLVIGYSSSTYRWQTRCEESIFPIRKYYIVKKLKIKKRMAKEREIVANKKLSEEESRGDKERL